MSEERTFLQAEWYRHGLHDVRDMTKAELQQQVASFKDVLFSSQTSTPTSEPVVWRNEFADGAT